ncbi:MAG TPA: PilZ domain-containing protein [Polyangiaceae bacterium]|nr:PilZ domain-containing protein [Polyangiaceae bacterium]
MPPPPPPPADDDAPAPPPGAPPARKSGRLTINKEFASFDEFLDAYVTNISSGGVFIRTKQPLPVGSVVDLHFTVIADGLELIEGVGEVVRVDDNPAGMGVAFREVSPESRALLDRLLAGRT